MDAGAGQLINLLTLVLVVIGLLAAIPSAIAAWRNRRRDDDAKTIASQDRRIQSLERDLVEVKTQLKDKDIALERMGAKLDELRRHNTELQSYLRLDIVPPALAEHLESVANAHHAQTQRIISEEVGQFRQAVAAALAEIAAASRSAVDDFTAALDKHFTKEGI